MVIKYENPSWKIHLRSISKTLYSTYFQLVKIRKILGLAVILASSSLSFNLIECNIKIVGIFSYIHVNRALLKFIIIGNILDQELRKNMMKNNIYYMLYQSWPRKQRETKRSQKGKAVMNKQEKISGRGPWRPCHQKQRVMAKLILHVFV